MLFKNTTELKAFFPVNISFDFDQVKPYISTAEEKYIIPLLGNEQWEEIQDYYESKGSEGSEAIPEFDALIEVLQKPIAYFAVYLASSKLDLKLMNAGFVVTETTGYAPASEHRTKNLKADLLRDAYDSVEVLLRFLEAHIEDYPNWENSTAYQENFQFFIRNAVEFDKEVRIDESRLTWLNYRPTMRKIQMIKIIPTISKDLADEILDQIKTDTVTEENEALLEFIRAALANFTAGIEKKDPELTQFGVTFLSEAKKLLYETPDNYPLFKASSAYVEAINLKGYQNTEESGLYVFGG